MRQLSGPQNQDQNLTPAKIATTAIVRSTAQTIGVTNDVHPIILCPCRRSGKLTHSARLALRSASQYVPSSMCWLCTVDITTRVADNHCCCVMHIDQNHGCRRQQLITEIGMKMRPLGNTGIRSQQWHWVAGDRGCYQSGRKSTG